MRFGRSRVRTSAMDALADLRSNKKTGPRIGEALIQGGEDMEEKIRVSLFLDGLRSFDLTLQLSVQFEPDSRLTGLRS